MSQSEVIDVSPADPAQLAWKELSDLGNAERLEARYRGRLVHVEGRGWMAFADTHWSAEIGEVLAHKAAHSVARAMREEIAALAEAIAERRLPPNLNEEIAKERLLNLRRWSVMSGNANKTGAMLNQASNLMCARRDEFDSEPLAINCRNFTLRAVQDRQGKWSIRKAPHDPTDMISRVADVDYDPDATCPLWEERLTVVLPDPEVRKFFRQCVGYALTGLTREQCIFLLQGRGGDGKSTTMDELRGLMGGYAVACDVQTFMAGAMRSGADASPDLARLAGDVRLVSTGEPRRGGQLDEAKIKSITGGSPIAARGLHEDLFEYVPGFKLFLECNAKPRISGDDDGIWRRIVVIMFPHQFGAGSRSGSPPHTNPGDPEREEAARRWDRPDKAIKDKLAAERPGILNWALAGMLEWLEAGELVPPKAVVEAVEDYRRGANPFGEWMAERVDTSDPNSLILAADLYADYKKWCEDQGVGDRDVMTSTAFGRSLGDRQILKGPRDGAGRVRRRGARLRNGQDPRSNGNIDVAGEMLESRISQRFDGDEDVP
ncbi:MAG TPA: phage/plasmid primase, P4 family [Sphingomicrobium sp.]